MPGRAATLKMLSALIPILCSGCESAGRDRSECVSWRAILIAPGDSLTRGTAEQILVHNATGERLQCWNPATWSPHQ